MNADAQATFGGPRLVALARRLRLSPAELVVLLARLAQAPDARLDGARLAGELARVRGAAAATARGAALLRLEPTTYALDELDRLLTLTWSAEAAARG